MKYFDLRLKFQLSKLCRFVLIVLMECLVLQEARDGSDANYIIIECLQQMVSIAQYNHSLIILMSLIPIHNGINYFVYFGPPSWNLVPARTIQSIADDKESFVNPVP